MASSPAVAIALLVLAFFFVFAGLAWFLRSQVHVFVRAIFSHRQEKRDKADSTVANTGDEV